MFDPENKIFKLCAQGMELEGSDPGQAAALFMQAWEQAETDFERSVAAHYVARRQETIAGKLEWDEQALTLAMRCDDAQARAMYPSFYLNAGKGYEDLGDPGKAAAHYRAGLQYSRGDDGYTAMIRSGLENGLKRTGNL